MKTELESIIVSERYKITEEKPIGRGFWGVVYRAKDTLQDEEVAIKVLNPTEIANQQMRERQLNEFEVMRKEAGRRAACGNVVPRDFELDKNGKPFIVMPLYEKFFSDILEERQKNPFAGAYKSGLYIREIIDYSKDIINGLAEIHSLFGKAHCDLKPDNLAVDKQNKVLISDLGTSTYHSIGSSIAPRANMGYIFTQAPSNGEHADEKTDIWAFGSMLYKMFTGEYIFEKELNEAGEKGGAKAMKEFINQWVDEKGRAKPEYSKTIEEKLVKTDIPEEFKQIIKQALEGYCYNGSILKNSFENAVKTYYENEAKKNAFKEFRKKLKSKLLGGLGLGTAIGAFALGIAWLTYFAKPDYSHLQDLERQVEYRDADLTDIIFEIEQKYPNELKKLGNQEYGGAAFFHEEKYGSKTIVDTIITEWIKTGNETGLDILPDKFSHRFPYQGRGTPFNEGLRGLLVSLMKSCEIKEGIVDIEDLLTTAYLGTPKIIAAQKAVNNCDFKKYIIAKDEKGNNLVPEEKQYFLKRLMYNVSQALPQKVQIKQDYSQPESNGKSHE